MNNNKIKHLVEDFEAIEEFVTIVDVVEEDSHLEMSDKGLVEVTDYRIRMYIAIQKEFLTDPSADNKICLSQEALPKYANMPNFTDQVQELILKFYKENR